MSKRIQFKFANIKEHINKYTPAIR